MRPKKPANTKPSSPTPELDDVIAAINAAELTCFDTETTSLEPMLAQVVGLSPSRGRRSKPMYIPLAHRYPGVPEQLPLDTTLAKLKPWFRRCQQSEAGSERQIRRTCAANHGIQVRGVAHDTLLADYVLESHKAARHGLDGAAFPRRRPSSSRDVSRQGRQTDWLTRWTSPAPANTAPRMPMSPCVCIMKSGRRWRTTNCATSTKSSNCPRARCWCASKRNGVLIDAALLQKQSHDLGLQVNALEQRLTKPPANRSIWAHPQLGEILFGKLGLPVKRKTATGQPSTDEEVLTGSPMTIRCRN